MRPPPLGKRYWKRRASRSSSSDSATRQLRMSPGGSTPELAAQATGGAAVVAHRDHRGELAEVGRRVLADVVLEAAQQRRQPGAAADDRHARTPAAFGSSRSPSVEAEEMGVVLVLAQGGEVGVVVRAHLVARIGRGGLLQRLGGGVRSARRARAARRRGRRSGRRRPSSASRRSSSRGRARRCSWRTPPAGTGRAPAPSPAMRRRATSRCWRARAARSAWSLSATTFSKSFAAWGHFPP